MEIIIQDTLNLYKKMLNLPEGERAEFFGDEILKSFNPMFEIMHMPKTSEALEGIALSHTLKRLAFQ